MILRRKKVDTFHVVLNCCWTQIPNFHILLWLLTCRSGAGPRKMLTVTLKSPHKKVCFKRLVFFDFLKAKNEEKLKIFFWIFFLSKSKTILPILGAYKKCLNIFNFEFSFWQVFFYSKRNEFSSFPCDLKKIKTLLRAHGQISNFLELSTKLYIACIIFCPHILTWRLHMCWEHVYGQNIDF